MCIGFLALSCNSEKKEKRKTASREKIEIKKDTIKTFEVEKSKEINIFIPFNEVDTTNLYLADQQKFIFKSPNSKEIDEFKKEIGEDFYIIADDVNFYRSNAYQLLDSLNKKYYFTDKRFVRFVMQNQDTLYMDTKKTDMHWYILISDGIKKPMTYNLDYLDEYFKEN